MARAVRIFGTFRSEPRRHMEFYVTNWVVERNPALRSSVDSVRGDYSMFKDVMVLAESSEVVRVVIKGQEFWLPRSQIRTMDEGTSKPCRVKNKTDLASELSLLT